MHYPYFGAIALIIITIAIIIIAIIDPVNIIIYRMH